MNMAVVKCILFILRKLEMISSAYFGLFLKYLCEHHSMLRFEK